MKMRDILFRGKRKDNGEWVEGYYIKAKWYLDGKEMHIIFPLDVAIFPHTEVSEYEEIIPETVGQYTGLTDKNGKKIFEGDIVKCYDRNIDDEFIAVVEFGNPNCSYNWGFQLRPITETNFNIDILLWVEMEETGALIEVIGNIHDNPELLE
jgi:uncharacterized phage protein (TIGR01671 family)